MDYGNECAENFRVCLDKKTKADFLIKTQYT